MTTGAWVLLVAVVGALAFGAWRAYADGRFRGTHAVKGVPSVELVETTEGVTSTLRQAEAGAGSADDSRETVWGVVSTSSTDVPTLGERATLLQFSSAFCAPCRATRRTLADVAAMVPGVGHVEVDAEHHLELVRAVGVLRTPTTLVLDARGAEVTRAAGAPRKEQVLSALAGALS